MRTVKFRVWTGKYMCYPHNEYDRELFYNKTVGWTLWNPNTTKTICNEFDNPIMELLEFTGLKDANGKEIYEGDIVIDEDAIGVIEYVETGFYFKAKIQSDLYDEIDAEYNFDEDFKVLGNRFENPELLKED